MQAAMWNCSRAKGTPGSTNLKLHITREGDSYLRMVLVQGAQHILGPFGEGSALLWLTATAVKAQDELVALGLTAA
jgi:hypothetical protein